MRRVLALLKTSLLCGLLLPASSVLAQTSVTHLGRSQLPTPEEQRFVSRTPDGFCWIGGTNGLTRFDGSVATKVLIKDPRADILHTQNVQSPMFPDASGRLWFSTYSALHTYDPQQEAFTTLQLRHDGQLMTEEYRPFYFDDQKQELWLRAADQLWAYAVNTGSYRRLAGPTAAVHLTVIPAANRQFIILGSLWIGPGLEYFRIQEDEKPATPLSLNFPHKVTSTVAQGRDTVLLATDEGLLLLTGAPAEPRIRKIPSAGAGITGLAKGPGRLVYFNQKEQGIFQLSLPDLQTHLLVDATMGLRSNAVENLYFDGQNALWATLPTEGLEVINLQPGSFRLLAGPPAGRLSDLRQLPNGEILATTWGGAVYAATRQASQAIAWEDLSERADLPPGFFRPLIFTSFQNAYLHGQAAVTIYNFSTGAWRTEPVPESIGRGVFEGPDGEAIFLLNSRVWKLGQDPESTDPLALEEGQQFTSLFPLTDTTFYLVVQGTRLWHVTWTASGLRVDHKIPLPAEINCLTQTAGGQTYLGTSAGLYLLKDTSAVLLYNGAGNNRELNIVAITEGKDHRIWYATQIGLFVFDPSTGLHTYFSQAVGLPVERFSRATPIVFPDGEIWLGTEQGILAFDPAAVTSEALATPYLTQFRVNDRPYRLDSSARQGEWIVLPYGQNTLDFGLSTVSQHSSAASGLEYQLVEYDKQPIRVLPGTTVRYPNLPPDEYTLRLTAINAYGLPAGEQTLRIRINPPYWQTTWFRIAAVLAIAVILFAIYAALLHRERLKQQRLQEAQARIAAERDRIAGEVHDDLGGQISSILYLSEELLLTEANPTTERELTRINELSRNSLQNVRDIIFALDNRRVSLCDLGEQLRAAGEAFFADRHIDYQFQETLENPAFVLSSRHKRNLTLVVKEAWHNIAKHAGATHVLVTMHETDKLLHIEVTDNGKGFQPGEKKRGTGGYGVDNMQEKADSIGARVAIASTPGQGTRLCLSWPLQEGL
ncbi:histidine kinase [Neolewinella lacunae]|uniref:Histidine kinase domain-containing protein n=1 Tax=Neolewinella lacunae TaxID=1517758 RepID=A0A923PPM4_9BACT|nr:ATP-binding protein [Neolewinella lacunae]MBC6995476.1 hypothetical protein [Neolewinella lacunae]MDN3635064.1 histidine kinase [Neolewinella lacunae]